MLQRLRKLARALLLGFEQPNILDRDHRLVGEGLDQLDLFFGEWAGRRPRQREDTNRKALSHQRNSQNCTITSNAQDIGHFVLGVGLAIRNMNCSSFNQNAADAGFATRPD